MSASDITVRHNLIIEILSKQHLTFEELSAYLEKQSDIYGYQLSKDKRTFQRDINAINELHGVVIKCDKSTNRYYVSEIENSTLQGRLNDSLHILNAFRIAETHQDIIFFESRKSAGTENLHGLIHAAKKNLKVTFNYTKYWEQIPAQRTLQVYALKEAQQRWYVIGVDDNNNELRTFGLDRITDLEITNKRFKRNSAINIASLFNDSFGILSYSNKPETIELMFDKEQAGYIKTFPIHHSQKILSENLDSTVFQVKLIPSYDFLLYLMSFANRVKVLKPQKLQQEIVDTLTKTLNQYK
jgi:predicted DNA-binding transcriptional regulator YafY